MPSNKDLIREIEAASESLDKVVQTQGLDNAALSKLAEELAAELDALSNESEEETQPAKSPGFYLVKGKSLTSLRGVLSDECEVKASDFIEGDKTLKDLVKKKFVVEEK